ncbi:MAG: diaminopimelate epimerase [Bacteroidetes bacterium]|nr:MAG: diaminopimelate epimerase [Bacteroidota bacterium]
MEFWKYQGAGNDFILLDQRQQQWISRSDTDLVAFLCDRHFGIGADGLILLQLHPDYDFEMIYFNADGRESSMCGNGGRCIVAFAHKLGLTTHNCRFLAIDGPHEAIIPEPTDPARTDWVELKMSNVDALEALLPPAMPEAAPPPGQDFQPSSFILDTGSPHYVRFVPLLDQLDIVQEGRAIRYSDRFKAAGINVNLVQAYPDHLVIRTYERGVENETLACGTGVTAAALAYSRHKGFPPGKTSILVKARGGDLCVNFTVQPNGTFRDIWLCGPAKEVFQGTVYLPNS